MSTTNTNTTGPETSTSTASKPSSTSVSNSVQKKIAPGAVATNSTTSSTSNSDFTVAQHKNTSTPKKIRQKPPSSSSSSSPASTTSSNGTSNTFSSSTSNLSSITLPKDDDSSVMHISCTVASEEASTIETRHSRSRGTLVCVECGMRFSNIKSLQKHIQNKTVWTNRSLLGCRVSVMWCVFKIEKMKNVVKLCHYILDCNYRYCVIFLNLISSYQCRFISFIAVQTQLKSMYTNCLFFLCYNSYYICSMRFVYFLILKTGRTINGTKVR
jgi:hypothetical protein